MKILSAKSMGPGFRGVVHMDCLVMYDSGDTQKVTLTEVEYKKRVMLDKLSKKLDKNEIKELDSLMDDIHIDGYSEGYSDAESDESL